MAKLSAIATEFQNLKTAIAEERAQATAKLNELEGKIDELTANIQDGGTTEERDALLQDVKNAVTEVKAIIPDPAQQPEEPLPGEEGEGEEGPA